MLIVITSLLVASLVSGAARPAEAVPARWVIRDLGTFGGKQGEASAVNARGDVVVSSVNEKGRARYFLWQNGRARHLGMSGLLVPPALNNRGEVLGRRAVASVFRFFLWRDGRLRDIGVVNAGTAVSFDDDGVVFAAGSDMGGGVFRWRTGSWTSLPSADVVGGARSVAWGVNSRAQVVGDWDPTGLGNHAGLWQNGHWQDLGTLPGGGYSSAQCINEQGVITGSATVNRRGDVYAVIWKKGRMRDLGTLGGPQSRGGCMSRRGQVVGSADTRIKNGQGEFASHAFVWENGRMTDLGTLAGGKTGSSAWEVNERGQVIGSSDTTVVRKGGVDAAGNSLRGAPFTHAFVWQAGTMTDLGALPGGRESWATAINEHDQIVGWATDGNGRRHAVLWSLRSG